MIVFVTRAQKGEKEKMGISESICEQGTEE